MDEEEGIAGPPHRELYALLHVSPEASDEEIRRAYRQWAQVYHPDKYRDLHVCSLSSFRFACFRLLAGCRRFGWLRLGFD